VAEAGENVRNGYTGSALKTGTTVESMLARAPWDEKDIRFALLFVTFSSHSCSVSDQCAASIQDALS